MKIDPNELHFEPIEQETPPVLAGVPRPIPFPEANPLNPGQVTTNIPNPETVAAIKNIVAHLQNFNTESKMVTEHIDEGKAVKAKLNDLAKLDMDEPNLLENAAKIGVVGQSALGHTITITEAKKTLFEVTILNEDKKEIFVIFDSAITKKGSILRGGKSELPRTIKVTEGEGTPFLRLKTEALKPTSTRSGLSNGAYTEKLLRIHRLNTIKTSVSGLPDNIKEHLILPHKVSVVTDESGTTLTSFVEFKEGKEITPLEGDAPEKVGKQLLEIFAALHNEGITHNDIKDQNLLISPDMKVYVLDWDTAINKNDPDDTKNLNGMTRMNVPPEGLKDPAFHKEAREIQKWVELQNLFNLRSDLEEKNDPEFQSVEKAILGKYQEEIKSIKSEFKKLEGNEDVRHYFQAVFGVENFDDLINGDANDLTLLNLFASIENVEALAGLIEGQPEDLAETLSPLASLLPEPKITAFQKKQLNAELDETKLKTHESLVKNDSYQLGIVLKNLFSGKFPLPSPYDVIIPGLLNDNPEERMSVGDALKLLPSS